MTLTLEELAEKIDNVHTIVKRLEIDFLANDTAMKSAIIELSNEVKSMQTGNVRTRRDLTQPLDTLKALIYTLSRRETIPANSGEGS
jgi:hypothetical protein